MKAYPPYLDYPKPRKPQTNADRLRGMSDEELALFLYDRGCFAPNCAKTPDGVCYESCNICWLDWLKSTVEVEDGRS